MVDKIRRLPEACNNRAGSKAYGGALLDFQKGMG